MARMGGARAALVAALLIVFGALLQSEASSKKSFRERARGFFSRFPKPRMPKFIRRRFNRKTYEMENEELDGEYNVPFFTMNPDQINVSHVAHFMPLKSGRKNAVIQSLEALHFCFTSVALPSKYVVVDVDYTKPNGSDPWSLLRFPRVHRDRRAAIENIAHSVVVLEELYHETCPKMMEFKKKEANEDAFLTESEFKDYAHHVLKIAIHKAMLLSLPMEPWWNVDQNLVINLFNAASDIRKNPKRLRALDRSLSKKNVMEHRQKHLATVLESWVTSDIMVLQKLNAVRKSRDALTALQTQLRDDGIESFKIMMMNRYPRIADMVEGATQRVYDSLLKVFPEGTFIRVNETLPCKGEDNKETRALKFRIRPFSQKYVYVPKFRQASDGQSALSSPSLESTSALSEYSRHIASLYNSDAREQERLAEEIEKVRPDCFMKDGVRELPEDQYVKVPVSHVRQYRNLIDSMAKAKKKKKREEREKEALTNFAEESRRATGKVLPASLSRAIPKSALLKFLKHLGISVLAVATIGVGFFMMICLAGFAMGGVGSFLTCAAGAALAGTSFSFFVSPAIGFGVAGLMGVASTALWGWRVHAAVSKAVMATLHTGAFDAHAQIHNPNELYY